MRAHGSHLKYFLPNVVLWPIPLKYEMIYSTKNDAASEAQDIAEFIWVWGKDSVVFYGAKIYG